MKKIRTWAITLLWMLVGTEVQCAEVPRGPNLGRPAPAQDIAAWDTDVMPDGAGLPAGRGTAKQGARIYKDQCQSCHGENGLGDSGDQLAGAQHKLTDEWPEKTIGTYWPYAPTLFDFIRRSMPMQTPGSLSDDESYALTAYLLYLNGIVRPDDELNAGTLAKVKMPNRNGFIDMHGVQ